MSANELVTQQKSGVLAEQQVGRVSQEVQAGMAIAKRFPRDEDAAMEKMLAACKRQRMAEASQYAYKRGSTLVTGPSIRLAEVMAQTWGNLDFGIQELEQRPGESVVMAYCWDMETNVRQTKIFTVPHARHTKTSVTALTDPRDIYEIVANNGARRLRACILGIIPQDIQEACIEQCNKTLAGGKDGKSINERIVTMCEMFGQQNVTIQMIEGRIGHKIEATTEAELVNLRHIFTSLRDGMSSVGEWFPVAEPKKQKVSSVNELLAEDAAQTIKDATNA